MDTSKLVVKEALLRLAPAPIQELLVRALLELVQNGWTESGGWILLDPEHQVVWLEDEDKPVAVLTVETVESHRLLWLPLVYVVPAHRRKGLFLFLLQRVRFGARAKGMKAVQLGTHHTNQGMQRAATAACMQPTFLRYTIPALTDEEMQALAPPPARAQGDKR